MIVNGTYYPNYVFTEADLAATAVRMWGEGHDPLDGPGWADVVAQATLDRWYAESAARRPVTGSRVRYRLGEREGVATRIRGSRVTVTFDHGVPAVLSVPRNDLVVLRQPWETERTD